MQPTFTLHLTADEAAVVERVLHLFAQDDIPAGAPGMDAAYFAVSTASKFAWNLLEQAADQGVEFPEY
jgi:hypothetical protein